jgi:spore maturation protein B
MNKTMASTLMTTIDIFSQWCIPLIILSITLYAYCRKVKVYEVFVEGAKEGFNVAVMIIPYLVAILVAIGLFRSGRAMDVFESIVKPVTNLINMPPSILPLCFIRPLSGSGARGLMIEIFKEYGPDSFDGLIASCIQGSTETTFYVLAVYFGAVGVRNSRHAVPACLIGDIVGMIASVLICQIWPWRF